MELFQTLCWVYCLRYCLKSTLFIITHMQTLHDLASHLWPVISSHPHSNSLIYFSRMGGSLWTYETSCTHWAIGPPPKPAHTCYLPGDLQFVLSPICLPGLLKKLNLLSHRLIPGPPGKSYVPPFMKSLYSLLISESSPHIVLKAFIFMHLRARMLPNSFLFLRSST